MDFEVGQIVISEAGHDKGQSFLVLTVEGDFLLLADGRERKVAAPKRKRRKHVSQQGWYHHPVIGKLQNGLTVMDSEIRRALAAFRDESGGYDAWQKTT